MSRGVFPPAPVAVIKSYMPWEVLKNFVKKILFTENKGQIEFLSKKIFGQNSFLGLKNKDNCCLNKYYQDSCHFFYNGQINLT